MNLREEWVVLDSAPSTQIVAAERLAKGSQVGVVFAHDQTKGRGRFGRVWHSRPGESLTMSLVFAPTERPWLIGMAVALLAAETLDCLVQWPNDIVTGGKKVGGVLTELHRDDRDVLTPIVGIGLNLNQTSFPDGLDERATSASQAFGGWLEPLETARTLVNAVVAFPTPRDWADLSDRWRQRDATVGKMYLTPADTWVTAVGIGEEGELIGEQAGGTVRVFAGDAWFGP